MGEKVEVKVEREEINSLENILLSRLIDVVGVERKMIFLPYELLFWGYVGDPIFNMNIFYPRLKEKSSEYELLNEETKSKMVYNLTQSNLPLLFTEYYAKLTSLILSKIDPLKGIQSCDYLTNDETTVTFSCITKEI